MTRWKPPWPESGDLPGRAGAPGRAGSGAAGRFLAEHSETTARRAGDAIKLGLRSLARMPARARRISDDLHEFDIRFGKSRYVVQFRVKHDAVVVARIFHMREARHRSGD